jgi:hypothetical protein
MTNRETALADLVDQLNVLRSNSDPLETLRVLAWMTSQLDTIGHTAAAEARSQGDSWAAIGEAVGSSRQAAQQRFGS